MRQLMAPEQPAPPAGPKAPPVMASLPLQAPPLKAPAQPAPPVGPKAPPVMASLLFQTMDTTSLTDEDPATCEAEWSSPSPTAEAQPPLSMAPALAPATVSATLVQLEIPERPAYTWAPPPPPPPIPRQKKNKIPKSFGVAREVQQPPPPAPPIPFGNTLGSSPLLAPPPPPPPPAKSAGASSIGPQ